MEGSSSLTGCEQNIYPLPLPLFLASYRVLTSEFSELKSIFLDQVTAHDWSGRKCGWCMCSFNVHNSCHMSHVTHQSEPGPWGVVGYLDFVCSFYHSLHGLPVLFLFLLLQIPLLRIYLLTIIKEFPNFPRPWPKMTVFPKHSSPAKMHQFSPIFKDHTSPALILPTTPVPSPGNWLGKLSLECLPAAPFIQCHKTQGLETYLVLQAQSVFADLPSKKDWSPFEQKLWLR